VAVVGKFALPRDAPINIATDGMKHSARVLTVAEQLRRDRGVEPIPATTTAINERPQMRAIVRQPSQPRLDRLARRNSDRCGSVTHDGFVPDKVDKLAVRSDRHALRPLKDPRVSNVPQVLQAHVEIRTDRPR
jgi:hypothetical protein